MANLPDYVASAKPLSMDNRVGWFSNIAPTYAGIMLWFVFWTGVPVLATLAPGSPFGKFAGGALAHGVGVALLGLVIAAAICHFLFYLIPGLLGMKTGLPLYIVGTSTYGVVGGFLMPGFLMGVLQFGWLAVNAFFAGILLCDPFGFGPLTVPHAIVATLWAVAAAFVGLKGIQYVAKVATFFPIIPLVVLLVLFVSTAGGIGKFDPEPVIAAGEQKAIDITDEKTGEVKATLQALPRLELWQVIALMSTYVVGFFATAGAAGADIAMNSKSPKDVQIGGLMGVGLATIVAGGLAILIVAGVHGLGKSEDPAVLDATALMGNAVGPTLAKIFMYLLAIAAFPAACFSAFIASNSFKTTLPKVNPYVSVGLGTLVAVILAITGLAGNAIGVFSVIGASFGPVCGAMAADFLLSGRKWAGPRAGFNMAGWISWVLGFIVGAADFIPALAGKIPAPPVAAFVVGFVLYIVLAKAGLQSPVLPMPQRIDDGAKAG